MAALAWSGIASSERLGNFAANGLQFKVEQWRGHEARLQLQRLREDFAGPIRHRGDWQQLERIRDGVSEVLQWRGDQQELWVLLSRLDLQRAPAAMRPAASIMPRTCHQTLHLVSADGTSEVVQRRLACRQPAVAAIEVMTASALAQGWRISGRVGDRVLLQRGQHSVSMQPLPPSDVLLLQRGPGAGP